MRKSRLSLLVVATVIAIIVVAGCTSPTQTSPQVASSNASSTTASTTTTSAVKTSVSPSPSASVSPTPTASPNPTATPSPTPQPSGKIATSIAATGLNSPPLPTLTSGEPINWAIQVTSQATGTTVCGGSVTVSIPGHPGQVTSGGASGCFKTAYFTLSSGLPKGTYTATLSYSGDSTYQPSTHAFPITVGS
jgi:hypothetical protein